MRKLFPFPQLLYSGVTYILGIGFARYLGYGVDATASIMGGATYASMVVGFSFLAVYFSKTNYFRTLDMPKADSQGARRSCMISAIVLLFLSGAASLGMILADALPVLAAACLGCAILLFVVYSLPPFRLVVKGYGELLLSFLTTVLPPVFGYLLHGEEMPRMLFPVLSSLMLFALATFIVLSFPAYHEDVRDLQGTLLVRMGWRWTIFLHQIVILAGYFLITLGPAWGLPWRLAWPAFLAVPFFLAQMIWLQRIAGGGRTAWSFLIPLAVSSTGLAIYLMTITIWVI